MIMIGISCRTLLVRRCMYYFVFVQKSFTNSVQAPPLSKSWNLFYSLQKKSQNDESSRLLADLERLVKGSNMVAT